MRVQTVHPPTGVLRSDSTICLRKNKAQNRVVGQFELRHDPTSPSHRRILMQAALPEDAAEDVEKSDPRPLPEKAVDQAGTVDMVD